MKSQLAQVTAVLFFFFVPDILRCCPEEGAALSFVASSDPVRPFPFVVSIKNLELEIFLLGETVSRFVANFLETNS